MPAYVDIGTYSAPNHALECEGQFFVDYVEGGAGDVQVPVEILSDYSETNDTTLHSSRQLRLRVNHLNGTPRPSGATITTIDMGIHYTGDHFFITKPSGDTSRGYDRAFLIDEGGNVGIGWNVNPGLDFDGNVIGKSLPLSFKLDVNGSSRFATVLAKASITAPSITAQSSLTASNAVFHQNFTIEPSDGDEAKELDLGQGRIFRAPKLFVDQLALQVSDTLNAVGGLEDILAINNTSNSYGVNLKNLFTADFVKTNGWGSFLGDVTIGGLTTLGLVDPVTNAPMHSTAAGGSSVLTLVNSNAAGLGGLKFTYEDSGVISHGVHMFTLQQDGVLEWYPANVLELLNTVGIQYGKHDLPFRSEVHYSTKWELRQLTGVASAPPALLVTNHHPSFNPGDPVIEMNGYVGINEFDPQFNLEVYGTVGFNYDMDVISYIGRTAIGGSVHSNYAWFSHLLFEDDGEAYALIQSSTGTTHVNAPTGEQILFCNNNVASARIIDGGLRMPNGKSIVFDQTGAGIQQNYGTYGCVETVSSGNGWSGYACVGGYQGGSRHVFMSSGYSCGIYGESAAEWFIHCTDNAGLTLRYNDGVKLETLNDGVNIYGNHNTTGAIRQGGVDVINTSKQFVGTGGVDTTGGVAADENISTPKDMSCRDLTASRKIKAVEWIGIVQDPFAKLTIGSTASGSGNIDEIAFRSVNNDANSRSGYVQRIGFYGKAQYSNDNSVTALISCQYGSNVHYPTYPGNSSTQLKFSTTNTYGDFDERMSINGYHITTHYEIPFIPGTFVGFTAFNDLSPSHNDFNIYNPIVMDRTQHNFQSMYDTNNGVFVVPYNGNYYVSFTVWNEDGFAGFGLLESTNNGGTWSLYKAGTGIFANYNSTGLQSTVSNGEAHTYAGIVYLKSTRHYSFGWVSGNNPRYTSESQTRCSVHLISSFTAINSP